MQWYWDFADIRLKTNNISNDQKNYYDSVKIVISGAQNHSKRYSDLINSQINNYNFSEERKNELIEIRRNIKNIIKNPPANFYQAVQLIYFIHSRYGLKLYVLYLP